MLYVLTVVNVAISLPTLVVVSPSLVVDLTYSTCCLLPWELFIPTLVVVYARTGGCLRTHTGGCCLLHTLVVVYSTHWWLFTHAHWWLLFTPHTGGCCLLHTLVVVVYTHGGCSHTHWWFVAGGLMSVFLMVSLR